MDADHCKFQLCKMQQPIADDDFLGQVGDRDQVRLLEYQYPRRPLYFFSLAFIGNWHAQNTRQIASNTEEAHSFISAGCATFQGKVPVITKCN